VIRTRVGYTGGVKRNPTYHALGDHTESIQIDFDPQRISYSQLLQVFWASHDATARPYSRQYRAVVFFANAEQEQAARDSLVEIQSRSARPVTTEILPLAEFYRAEDYHQKYYLRHRPELWAEAAADFGDDARALTDSTLAARLNGYAGHFGSSANLQAELPSYSLSPAGADYLSRLAPGLTWDAPDGCGLPQ
jgi:peptide-methionine (S)-S-oxide reductase